MYSKVLVAAVVLALSSAAANAGDGKYTKETGTGMFGGAAVGAVVGGPIGAAVGFMLGGVLGDQVGIAKRADLHAQQLQDELAGTRAALAKASEQSNDNEMLDALAQRLQADVMFRTASADIDAQVVGKLAELGKLLAANSRMEVQLHGFADPRGTPEQNMELSMRRADAVREALIEGGAAPEQIRLSAHGEDLATATKDDLEAFAWERRVSLSIRPTAQTAPTAVAQAH